MLFKYWKYNWDYYIIVYLDEYVNKIIIDMVNIKYILLIKSEFIL